MGFILNRSIFVSLITYAGVVIGYLNVLWLYPLVLNLEQIGLVRFLQDTAMLLVPFAQMGAGQGLIKYFPYGNTKEEKQQLISIALVWSLFSFLFFLVIFWLFRDLIILTFKDNADAVNNFLPVILLLVFIMNLQAILEPLARSLLKFRFVAICKEILLRLLSALLILLYFFNSISFTEVVWGLVIIYGTVTLLIALYLGWSGWMVMRFRLSPAVREMLTPYVRFGLVTLLSSASSLLIMKTDSLMITQMIGLKATGIYTTVFFMAVVVELPRRILSQISTPLLSQAFEQNNMPLAQKIYHKSSLNLLLVSGLLFIGIICNMPALFDLMPKGEEFRTGAWIVVFIGIGKLVDGAAGVNGEILSMSKYYRINLYFTVMMAILNVILNYLLIPIYGIEGAALGSCLSLVIFNLLKFVYIQSKLGLQPFSQKTALMLLVLFIGFVAGWYFPSLASPVLDILVRSLLITLLVGVATLLFNISEEATSLYRKGIKLLRGLR